ncbi:MAG: hypothetical protein LJE74_11230 [Proteobacteria bacterium]|jgi:LAS superfamily LD-carboxypeptidase LdcB|nr:hypothetical protein [Pseudomonadota bacterium]
MKNQTQAWKFMVLILVSVFVAGACARSKTTPETEALNYTQEMREAVSLNVQDAGRRKQLLALIDKMDKLIESYNNDIRTFVNKFGALNANYDITRQEMDGLIAEFADQRRQAQARIIDLNLQARSLTTTKEWDQIVRYEKNAIEATIQPRKVQQGADK